LKLAYVRLRQVEVESYVGDVYKPGMEKKETVLMEAHRESFISAFKEEIEKLQINIKL